MELRNIEVKIESTDSGDQETLTVDAVCSGVDSGINKVRLEMTANEMQKAVSCIKNGLQEYSENQAAKILELGNKEGKLVETVSFLEAFRCNPFLEFPKWFKDEMLDKVTILKLLMLFKEDYKALIKGSLSCVGDKLILRLWIWDETIEILHSEVTAVKSRQLKFGTFEVWHI